MNNIDKLLADAIKNPAARPAFLKTLMKSKVFVIGKPAEEEADGSGNRNVNLMSVTNQEGVKCVPFFTSLARMELFTAKIKKTDQLPSMEMECPAFFRAVMRTGAILNPNSENSKFFSAAELQNLMGGGVVRSGKLQMQPGTEVKVTQPQKLPRVLVESLTRSFEARQDVNAAYFFLISYEKVPQHLMLAVDYSGERDPLFQAIGGILKPFLAATRSTVDVMDANDEFCQQFIGKSIPFYDKEKGISIFNIPKKTEGEASSDDSGESEEIETGAPGGIVMTKGGAEEEVSPEDGD